MDNYQQMARNELKQLAQARKITDHDGKLSWIATATKEELVTALEKGWHSPSSIPQDAPPVVGDLAQIIAQAVQAHLAPIMPEAPPIDEEAIRAIVQEELAGNVKRVEVTRTDGTTIDVGAQHKDFDKLCAVVSTGVPVYMVGPSGSGKTHAAEAVAKGLGLEFHCQSVSQQTTVSYLLGYMDANGRYITSEFRKAYEHGGLYLLDEIDAGNPNVLCVLNAALANDICAFPDGMIKRHDDFRLIAAANTYGRGADRQYVGRMQLDAATLNRFATLVWDYDEALERTFTDNQAWCSYVQAIRRAAAELQLRVVISPRATIFGSVLLKREELDHDAVSDMVLFAGMDAETVQKLKARAKVQEVAA